jgi:hypothetical protein
MNKKEKVKNGFAGGLTSLKSQARLAQAALRITPPAALAAGNEQSGKMARKTVTYWRYNKYFKSGNSVINGRMKFKKSNNKEYER